jgi:hypothetical protein
MYLFSDSLNVVLKFFAIRDPQTPPSTPQRHRDALRREEQNSRVMHTPEHRRIPARPSNADPFLDDAPVAGGTWQLPQPPANPLHNLEALHAQANLYAQNLYSGRGRTRGRGRGQASVSSNPPRILSLNEIHAIRGNPFAGQSVEQLRLAAQNISTPAPAPAPTLPPLPNPFAGHSVEQLQLAAQHPPANPLANNPFAGLSVEQLLLARRSLPTSGATTPAASRPPSRVPTHQHSHAPSPIPSHLPSHMTSRAASPSQYDDDTQMSLRASRLPSRAPSPALSDANRPMDVDQPIHVEPDLPIDLEPIDFDPDLPVGPLPLAMQPVDESLPAYNPSDLGPMDVECQHCHALHFKCEQLSKSRRNNIQFGSCCLNGKVLLPFLKPLPRQLARLFNGDHLESEHFLNHARSFNNAFAFTSVGVKFDRTVNTGRAPPVIKIQGALHHHHGHCLPGEDGSVKYAQVYWYETPQMQLRQRVQNNAGQQLSEHVMAEIQVNYSLFHLNILLLTFISRMNYSITMHMSIYISMHIRECVKRELPVTLIGILFFDFKLKQIEIHVSIIFPQVLSWQ